jgi:hypothetical protein
MNNKPRSNEGIDAPKDALAHFQEKLEHGLNTPQYTSQRLAQAGILFKGSSYGPTYLRRKEEGTLNPENIAQDFATERYPAQMAIFGILQKLPIVGNSFKNRRSKLIRKESDRAEEYLGKLEYYGNEYLESIQNHRRAKAEASQNPNFQPLHDALDDPDRLD